MNQSSDLRSTLPHVERRVDSVDLNKDKPQPLGYALVSHVGDIQFQH